MFFFSELASCISLWDRKFPSIKIPKSVGNNFFDTISTKFELGWHTWYLHEELISLVPFSPMKQEEEKKTMWHRFLQFEKAEVTKRNGLPPGKPDFKLFPSTKHINIWFKKTSLNHIYQYFNLSHSFLHIPASNWIGDKCS